MVQPDNVAYLCLVELEQAANLVGKTLCNHRNLRTGYLQAVRTHRPTYKLRWIFLSLQEDRNERNKKTYLTAQLETGKTQKIGLITIRPKKHNNRSMKDQK